MKAEFLDRHHVVICIPLGNRHSDGDSPVHPNSIIWTSFKEQKVDDSTWSILPLNDSKMTEAVELCQRWADSNNVHFTLESQPSFIVRFTTMRNGELVSEERKYLRVVCFFEKHEGVAISSGPSTVQ